MYDYIPLINFIVDYFNSFPYPYTQIIGYAMPIIIIKSNDLNSPETNRDSITIEIIKHYLQMAFIDYTPA